MIFYFCGTLDCLKDYFLLFIFGCAVSLLLHGLFSRCGKWGRLSSCSVEASHCGGFSLQLPGSWARLNSCGSWAYLLCSTWELPGSGLNPCLLHWQADSLPLSHQGSPSCGYRRFLFFLSPHRDLRFGLFLLDVLLYVVLFHKSVSLTVCLALF